MTTGRKILFSFILIALMLAVFIPLSMFLARKILTHNQTFFTRNEKLGKPYSSYYNQKYHGHHWLRSHNDVFDVDGGEFKYTYHTNGFGFRDDTVGPKSSEKLRILFLGDSYIEGYGAPADSSMPAFLRKRLLNEGYSVEILNGGVAGSDPFFALKYLNNRLFRALSPDIVVCFTSKGDFDDFVFRGGPERFKEYRQCEFRKGPSWEHKYEKDQLYRFYVHKILGLDQLFLDKKLRSVLLKDFIEDLTNLFNNTRDLEAKHNFKFIVGMYPIPQECLKWNQVDKWDSLVNVQLPIQQSLRQNFPDIIDTYPGFKEKLDSFTYQQMVWPIDGHFKGLGYQLFAEIVYDEIMKNEYFKAKLEEYHKIENQVE